MTKLKSKKMTKSTFAIIIMAIAMVAMLAFGGTYAYFTATANATGGKVTAKTLTIGGQAEGTTVTLGADSKIVPGQTIEITELDNLTAAGDTVAAFRIKLELGKVYQSNGTTEFSDENLSTYVKVEMLNAEGTDKDSNWIDGGDGYLYYNTITDGDTFAKLGDKVGKMNVSLSADAGNAYQGIIINFSIKFEAMQAEFHGTNMTKGTTVVAENADEGEVAVSAVAALWA